MKFSLLAPVLQAVVSRNPPETDTLLKRFAVIRAIARRVLPEYRFHWPQMCWWQSESFNRYLDLFSEREGNNTDRRFTVGQLLRLIADVPGATAEVGCYEGAMSWLICHANQGARVHHIFDSFEGLSEPAAVDGGHWHTGALACSEERVQLNLKVFSGNFHTYRGWVPERFADVAGLHFAFVHIDVDLHDPTYESLAFFYPRLNPGGILVCDDYGFTSCPGAQLACDTYLRDKPESMIQLAAGGGFFIKGTATAVDPAAVLQ